MKSLRIRKILLDIKIQETKLQNMEWAAAVNAAAFSNDSFMGRKSR